MVPKICAYCGGTGDLTREHVLPAWLQRALDGYLDATPARGRHVFGGELVIDDVCASCNNGPLSRLDEGAKQYWDSDLDLCEILSDHEGAAMARWAAKVAYNAQRAVYALGTAGHEPPMPRDLPEWVLKGGNPPPSFAVSIARMPVNHRDRLGAGIFASRGTELPRRYVHFRGSVLYAAWDPPNVKGVGQYIAGRDRQIVPAAEIGVTHDPVAVPLMADPDHVRRGFWNDEVLLRSMAERYR